MFLLGKNSKRNLTERAFVLAIFVLVGGSCTSHPVDPSSDNVAATPTTSQGAGDFTIQNGDITLGGTLTLPSTPGPHPAVVVVHGSGRATRNSFSALSDLMGNVGIAVLRYDKRGVAESSGTYENVGPSNSVRVFDELASDALAWVNFLRSHADIKVDRIGLIGASQAGWIIPLAASQSDDLAFIVNIVGPTVTVGQEIFYSDLTGEGRFREDRTINGFTIEQLTEMTRSFAGPHGFDPRPAISSLDIPALWNRSFRSMARVLRSR
jgi:hypothetical protein